MTAHTPPAFDEWCIVELLGHRRVAAHVTETTIAGAGLLRLDEPDGRTQLVSPAAVYAIHPTTEDVVRALAGKWRTEPVQRWELPPAPPADTNRADDGPACPRCANDPANVTGPQGCPECGSAPDERDVDQDDIDDQWDPPDNPF